MRNSSCNSARATPWRLAEHLSFVTLKLLQQDPRAAVAMKFVEARKIALLFQSVAKLSDLEHHSYGGKHNDYIYPVLRGFHKFWGEDFLCHRGPFLCGVLFYNNCWIPQTMET